MPHSIELTVIDLRVPPVPAEELASFLSPDEQARAERFRLTHLKHRFCTGRGLLRYVLGKASSIAPRQVCFMYSAQGKPIIPGLHFNVSHSGDLWACAFGGDSPIGIDIEQIRPMPDCEAIARRFFAPSEYQQLAQYPEDARLAAFFRCWTRKEAYIKALGDGLSRGLSTFAVSVEDQRLSTVRDSFSAEEWLVRSFDPAPGYAGALATR